MLLSKSPNGILRTVTSLSPLHPVCTQLISSRRKLLAKTWDVLICAYFNSILVSTEGVAHHTAAKLRTGLDDEVIGNALFLECSGGDDTRDTST